MMEGPIAILLGPIASPALTILKVIYKLILENLSLRIYLFVEKESEGK